MPAYRPHQSAREVDSELRRSLTELETAQRNAVLWFADVLKRRLFQELGCSSIHQYAAERLGFSPARTSQFLELARALESLPALRRSLARGEVPWTKARAVVKVATPKTEAFWVEQARTTSRRELEHKVAVVRARAKERAGGTEAAGELFGGDGPVVVAMATEVPVDVRLRFTPEQYARFEALLETATRDGHAHSREETLLAALESLAAGGGDFTREKSASESIPAPRYHVTVHQCPDCGKAEIVTDRGNRPVALPELQSILCDARIQRPGERNTATIPPARRREVLARDGHRCRGRGCGGTRFLDVHHVVPRDHGGSNDPENLITLCAPCHRLIHRGKAIDLRPVEGS
jgi:predicted RNA-binding Zn-ribbon protein involved in translation (DUF1610 family)